MPHVERGKGKTNKTPWREEGGRLSTTRAIQ